MVSSHLPSTASFNLTGYRSMAHLQTEANTRVPNARAKHRRNGVCAEILATAMYMKKHDNQPPRSVTGGEQAEQAPRARVAVWGEYLDGNPWESYRIKPCGPSPTDTQWGCSAFMKYQGITIIDVPSFRKEIRGPAGYPDLPISQIEPVEVQNMGVPLGKVSEPAATTEYDDVDFDEDMDIKLRL